MGIKQETGTVTDFRTALAGFDLVEKDLIAISERFKTLHVEKGETFCKRAKVCNQLGILLSGLLMAKFDTKKGKLNVSRFFFAPDNIIVTSFESFSTGNLSQETIVALEDSTLLSISASDLQELYKTIPATNRIGRHFAEKSYIAALQRIHDLQVLSNPERIEKFFTNYQFLYNRVSITNLASYLRVNRNDLGAGIRKMHWKK